MRLTLGNRSEKLSDQDIILGIQNGDGYFVKHLFLLCKGEITRYVTNNNGSKIEADDIIQETIIAVFEKIKDNRFKLNSDTKLSTFLFAVGKYKWYNELRKRRVMTPFPTENGFDLEDDLENYYLKEERYEQLKRLIERLDEVCRQILKERYWLRKKFEEIKISSCRSVDALKMKSSRCHKQLRELHG